MMERIGGKFLQLERRKNLFELITQLRQKKLIKNDDTTMAIIKVFEEIPANISVQQENEDSTSNDTEVCEPTLAKDYNTALTLQVQRQDRESPIGNL